MFEVVNEQRGPKNGRGATRRRRQAGGARGSWYEIHRLLRVTSREATKAAIEATCYGTGAIRVPAGGGDPEHVPWHDLLR